MKIPFGIISFLLICHVVKAADIVGDSSQIINSFKVIHLHKSDQSVKLDGILNEAIWDRSTKYADFWMKFPTNSTLADPKTEIQVTYDDTHIYFGIKVYEAQEGNIVQSLKRDQGLRAGDGLGIVLDPVNLKTNGFYFAVSPYNSQTEGLIGNSFDDVTFTWDNTWYSYTKRYDHYWVAEVAIPFSILRYDQVKKVWGINFIRAARTENEFHTWTQIPLQFKGTDLGYLGQMIWDQNPPPGGSTVSLNPYVTSSVSTDPENMTTSKLTANAGMDAKVAISSSLNLDLTINPDFSNVDVDQQVTNLTRFSIFFPERRVFFLENDDLFSKYGIPPVRPFYSRRIGSKNGLAVPILFGARLSGNLNKNLRFGIMNIQTGRKEDASPDNFTSVTFNQQVFDRSVIKGYFINRSAIQNETEKLSDSFDAFGRNVGLEYNYNNKNGDVQAWIGRHQSYKPEIKDKNAFMNGGGGYFGQNFTSFVDLVHIGRNYYADVGFVNRIENYDAQRDTTIRVGTNFFYNENAYTWYPKNGVLNNFSVGANNFIAYDEFGKFNERNLESGLSFSFKNASSAQFNFNNNNIRLLYPFKFVSDDSAEPLPTGLYHFNNIRLSYTSDARKNFVYGLGGRYGKFYNADYTQVTGLLNIRKQPYVSLNVALEYNRLVFPGKYGKQEFWLVAPQTEINF
ncbi:MAG: DUF5916 domain-containing protein, partial [Saprospiraceae bacterium]